MRREKREKILVIPKHERVRLVGKERREIRE
jgi:hypothetical protein